MSALEKIAQIGIKKVFKKDEIICMQQDAGDCMYIVLKGVFGVYINSMTDFPVRVAELTAGQFFGEMSVLDGAPRSATVIAEEDSIAISLSGGDFKKLIQCDSELAFMIMRSLSGRIRALNERLEKSHAQTKTLKTSDALKEPDKSGKIMIMPENHALYQLPRPEKYDYFVTDKEALCPLCGRSFQTSIPIFSKLSQKDRRVLNDQRVVYENFCVLWFSVWICPHCNYADYYSTFGRSGEDFTQAMKALRESGYTERVEKFSGKPTASVDSVIKSYYLADLCNQMGEKSIEKSAKNWLRLYWLYGDVKDEGEKIQAAKKALSLYGDVLQSAGTDEKMTVLAIMGELSIYLKDYAEAVKHYQFLLDFSRKKNAALAKQATERLFELQGAYRGEEGL